MLIEINYTNWDICCEGYRDAGEGEPLFDDADPAYAAGWRYFHGIATPRVGIATAIPSVNLVKEPGDA